ncbi:hypothetical protein AB6C53_08320 [Vibrio splendidus]
MKSDYANEVYLYFLKGRDSNKPTSSFLFFLFGFLFLLTVVPIFFVISLYMVLFPRCKEDIISDYSSICVCRSFATDSKLSFLKGEVRFYSELMFGNKRGNLYNVPLIDRILCVFISYRVFFNDVFLFLSDIKKSNLIQLSVFTYYIVRIPHKCIYESFLSNLLVKVKPDRVYTGNKEDRFALVEGKLCQRLGIDLVCYPHGLEYGFKLPRGVVGNKFYTYSKIVSEIYSDIYSSSSQKFIFSEDIASKLLLGGRCNKIKYDKVVFFPESKGTEINLKIVKSLFDSKIDFQIKLHPLDRIEHYLNIGVDESRFIDSFDEAMQSKYILARKSTVLIEAVYAQSFACAILIDDDEVFRFENDFPSLLDPRIRQFYNVESFVEWLENTNKNRDTNK